MSCGADPVTALMPWWAWLIAAMWLTLLGVVLYVWATIGGDR